MIDIVKATVKVPRITWQLQPRGTKYIGMYDHIMDVLNGTLHKYAKFKFGTTHLPANRLEKFDTFKQSPQLLVMVVCSESSKVIARLEEECVANFRGDSRMLNFRDGGGDWARIGVPPHFLYIAFSRRLHC